MRLFTINCLLLLTAALPISNENEEYAEQSRDGVSNNTNGTVTVDLGPASTADVEDVEIQSVSVQPLFNGKVFRTVPTCICA